MTVHSAHCLLSRQASGLLYCSCGATQESPRLEPIARAYEAGAASRQAEIDALQAKLVAAMDSMKRVMSMHGAQFRRANKAERLLAIAVEALEAVQRELDCEGGLSHWCGRCDDFVDRNETVRGQIKETLAAIRAESDTVSAGGGDE